MNKYSEFKGLVTDTTSVYSVNRTPVDKKCERSSHNFKGCLHGVGFKVDYPIELVGLGFYGPAKNDYADYIVRTMVCRTMEDWSQWNWLLSCFCGGPYYKIVELMNLNDNSISVVKKGENFIVPLPHPVYILPNLWTDIKFELVGPDTECIKYGFVGSESDEDKDSGVHFEFLAGSTQLPTIYYTIPPAFKH